MNSTAALDPKAEAEVFDQFHEPAVDRTAVVISHRLSTVRHADRILGPRERPHRRPAPTTNWWSARGCTLLFETQARPSPVTHRQIPGPRCRIPGSGRGGTRPAGALRGKPGPGHELSNRQWTCLADEATRHHLRGVTYRRLTDSP
jgi:energy-coupling factor transporter ATP-binding protein EcfA2